MNLSDSDCILLRGAEAGLPTDVMGGGDANFICVDGTDGPMVPVRSHPQKVIRITSEVLLGTCVESGATSEW
jgi:hypothetical protein